MTKSCKHCGNAFNVKPSWHLARIYCSRKCMAESYKTRLVGSDNPHFGSRTFYAHTCVNCGREFENRNPSAKKCSRKCDRQKKAQMDLAAEAENLACEAQALLELSASARIEEKFRQDYVVRSRRCRAKSDALFAMSSRKEARLKSLGEKLACIRTILMTAITDDPSVV